MTRLFKNWRFHYKNVSLHSSTKPRRARRAMEYIYIYVYKHVYIYYYVFIYIYIIKKEKTELLIYYQLCISPYIIYTQIYDLVNINEYVFYIVQSFSNKVMFSTEQTR